MTAKVIRCNRCRKRCRRMDGWNAEFVAGVIVACICPQCQSADENAEAEVNEVLSTPSSWQGPPTTAEALIERLVKSYPTPERMRHQANRLAAARTDRQAQSMVALMNNTASAMADGTLWDDPPQRS